MLHLNVIEPETFQILTSLLGKQYLENFSLVRGTSLSLRYGHRKSIDLDLFSTEKFTPDIIHSLLTDDYPGYLYRGSNRFMHFCTIDDIKIDIVNHPFPLLSPVETVDTIRMFSVEDVAAMKCFAICKRGTRKDFYDLWQLLQEFSPHQIINFFVEKYGKDKLIFFNKSVIYFDEADDSDQPEVLISNLTWDKVKKEVYRTFVNL